MTRLDFDGRASRLQRDLRVDRRPFRSDLLIATAVALDVLDREKTLRPTTCGRPISVCVPPQRRKRAAITGLAHPACVGLLHGVELDHPPVRPYSPVWHKSVKQD